MGWVEAVAPSGAGRSSQIRSRAGGDRVQGRGHEAAGKSADSGAGKGVPPPSLALVASESSHRPVVAWSLVGRWAEICRAGGEAEVKVLYRISPGEVG